MNNKLWLGVAAAFVLLAAFSIYMSQSADSTAQSAGIGASLDVPAKIGFIGPTTGPFADWGMSLQYGAELATEDTRHKFAIDYQDDACDPKQAVNIINKFFSTENVHVVVGPGCDDSLKSITSWAKQNDAVLLSTGLLEDEVFAQNPQHVINLATQISTEAEFTAAYMRAQGVKKVAIIHGDNSFGQEYGVRLPEKLAQYGIETTIDETTSLKATDFRTIILKMLKTKPDVIWIHQGDSQVGIFAKQLRLIDKKIPLYGYYVFENPDVLEAGGAALEGVQYTYPVNSADGSKQKDNFEKRYFEKFGVQPTASSAFVYDGVMLLDKALDVCSATDGACVEKFLKNYGEYEGLSGKMEIQPDGKNIRPFGIKEIKNGKFEWVSKDIKI